MGKDNTMDEEISNYIRENIQDERIIKKALVTFIPSMKQLFRVLRKNGIFIDSQDTELKTMLRKAYKLKNENGFDKNMRLAYFSLSAPLRKLQDHEDRISTLENKKIKKDSLVFCNEIDYGIGEVEKLYTDNLMAVKFQNRELKTMCDSKNMGTVHDDKKRKIRIL